MTARVAARAAGADRTDRVDRKAELLRVARELFATQSYEKVTTTEIAREAGVAYGLIAHHFGNKRGLFLAVVAQIGEELAALHDAGAGLPPAQRLRVQLAAHVDYVDRHAGGFVAMMRHGLGADPDVEASFRAWRWDAAWRVLSAIGVPADPPPVLRAAVLSWLAGVDELLLDRVQNADIEVAQVVELAVASLVASIRRALELLPPGAVGEATRTIVAAVAAAVASSPPA